MATKIQKSRVAAVDAVAEEPKRRVGRPKGSVKVSPRGKGRKTAKKRVVASAAPVDTGEEILSNPTPRPTRRKKAKRGRGRPRKVATEATAAVEQATPVAKRRGRPAKSSTTANGNGNGAVRMATRNVRKSVEQIAAIWSVLLGTPVTAHQVALCTMSTSMVYESSNSSKAAQESISLWAQTLPVTGGKRAVTTE